VLVEILVNWAPGIESLHSLAPRFWPESSSGTSVAVYQFRFGSPLYLLWSVFPILSFLSLVIFQATYY
jgi:hypothetical protein